MKYMSSHFNCCFLSLCDKRPRKENKTCNIISCKRVVSILNSKPANISDFLFL